jgi:catechol 2,3-dioxygenase-like lactoylglutathione lyase family enzyme
MRRLVLALLALLALVACSALPCLAAEPAAFPRTTIDLGCVVSDLDASVRFYTEGIGFRTLPGFSVEAPLVADAGLTDTKRLDITVLVLGEGEQATRLKLMQVEGTAPRRGDNEFIHSHTGFRYLTIVVADTDAALARLAKLGVKPLAKSPVALPDQLGKDLFLTCVRDPDGNLIELIGPRATP